MTMKLVVTVFVLAVLLLVSGRSASASSQSLTAQNKSTTKAKPTGPDFSITGTLSRSTNLVDFRDGSKYDGMDFSIAPSLTYSYGRYSTVLAYSQNMRDPYSTTENDFSDIPITFSFKPTEADWFYPYSSKISYSLTAVIPVSKLSTRKDNLQTSISGKAGFTVAEKGGDGFSANVSLSLGKNFHAYEEDINGSVLNQFSSNQAAMVSYTTGAWSFSVDFTHRTRWTYKNNVKNSFQIGEDVSYSFTDNFSASLGHTNSGSTLKPNGTDSNIDIYDENSSMIYGSISASY